MTESKGLQLQQQLAEIAAGIEEIQDLRIGVDAALANVLLELQPSFLQPAAERLCRFAAALGEVEDDEALTLSRMTRMARRFLGPGGGSVAL